MAMAATDGIRVDKDGGVLCVDLAQLAAAVEWRSRIAQGTGVPISDTDEDDGLSEEARDRLLEDAALERRLDQEPNCGGIEDDECGPVCCASCDTPINDADDDCCVMCRTGVH